MKVKMKMIDTDQIDKDNLDELIGMCEEKMVQPFRKKKEEEQPVEWKSEPDLILDEEHAGGMSEEDLQKLLEMYSELKDRE